MVIAIRNEHNKVLDAMRHCAADPVQKFTIPLISLTVNIFFILGSYLHIYLNYL
jgi:hypothetical protein